MTHTQSLRNALVLVGFFSAFASYGFTQTFSKYNGDGIQVCSVPNYPGPCTDVDPRAPQSMLQMMTMAQIEDLTSRVNALTDAIKSLKQSNDDAAKAIEDASKKIQLQNDQFNKDFSAAIADKLANYPADFVNSPAYQQLRSELVDMINRRLPTTPAPADNQTPAPAGTSSTSPERPSPTAARPASNMVSRSDVTQGTSTSGGTTARQDSQTATVSRSDQRMSHP